MKATTTFLALLCLLLNGCVGSPAKPNISETTGRVRGGTYGAASKKYSLPAPVEFANGGKVQTSPFSFSFSDDSGRLFHIEEMALPPGIFDGSPERRVGLLDGFLSSVYLPQTILKVFPESTSGALESLPELQGGARYSEVFMPKGSMIVHSKDGKSFERFDSARGVVYFVRGTDLFVVSVALAQLRPLPDDRKKFSADLRAETLRFLSTIEFSPASERHVPN
jgi:hypothetical protein